MENIHFTLPNGFHFITNLNDEGQEEYFINSGKTVSDDGQENYEFRSSVSSVAREDFDMSFLDLESATKLCDSPETHIITNYEETGFMGLTIKFYVARIIFLGKDEIYQIVSTSMLRPGEDLNEDWVNFLNELISGAVVDGQTVTFEKLTLETIKSTAESNVEEESTFPTATPEENQHTHLDFLNKTKNSFGIFGGLFNVNQTGTEFSFESCEDYFCDEDSEPLYTPFELSEKALKMAELFRVNEDVFDPSHDREQEITYGYIQRCTTYNALRSFAWTLAALCAKDGIEPCDVPIFLLDEMVSFIMDEKECLNYAPNSYCPTLCSGDDLHNYYLPEGLSEEEIAKFKESSSAFDPEFAIDEDGEPHYPAILSLDGLRADLEYIYPAIQTIYDALAENRDRDEALEGNLADILYAWCSAAYAARDPIYTEDGPINCFWDHPGNIEDDTCNTAEAPYTLTYENKIKYENDEYTFVIPDGFVFSDDNGERDFIAYLPSEEDPSDFNLSDFIIFAGRVIDGSINSQLSLPISFAAFYGKIISQMPGIADMWTIFYERKDLPGVFYCSMDQGYLHANALLGYGSTIKTIRLQINLKSKAFAEPIAKAIIDHMSAKNPVAILDELDCAELVSLDATKENITRLEELFLNYGNQLAIARSSHQECVAAQIQNGSYPPARIKKMLQKLIDQHVAYADIVLKKGDALCQLMRYKAGNDDAVSEMLHNFHEIMTRLASQHLDFDDDSVSAASEYLEAYNRHRDMAPAEAISDILASADEVLSPEIIEELKKILQ